MIDDDGVLVLEGSGGSLWEGGLCGGKGGGRNGQSRRASRRRAMDDAPGSKHGAQLNSKSS